jgi:hypothetical protein
MAVRDCRHILDISKKKGEIMEKIKMGWEIWKINYKLNNNWYHFFVYCENYEDVRASVYERLIKLGVNMNNNEFDGVKVGVVGDFTEQEKREILYEQFLEAEKKKRNDERCDLAMFEEYGSGVFLI